MMELGRRSLPYWILLLLILPACSTVRPIPNHRKGFFSQLEAQERGPARIQEVARTKVHLRWPLTSIKVTSGYGRRSGGFHEGVDLRAPQGTSVYAAESGTILYADRRIHGYGRMVVIQHAGRVATVYAHNSKVLVRKGQKVTKGQRIAFSGQTGSARGPHVHFEVRYGVNAVDPAGVIR